MDHPQFVEQTEPEDVFSLLADDNRVDILRALWDSDDAMTFSELHDAVGIRDSGQFNYHLDKLVGQFVTKTDDGYELTAAGGQINGAIEAGSYTTSGTMEPVALDPPCPTCGGTRTFHYEDEVARLECDSCDVQAEFPIPPSAFVGCDREEIPDVAGRYLGSLIERLDNGFCSQCDGPVERTVCRLTDSVAWEQAAGTVSDAEMVDPRKMPIVQYECLQCGSTPTSGLNFTLLTHPEVVEFYYDRGIDIRNRSVWEIATFETDTERVQGTDPFRASTTFTAGGDELTLVVDGDGVVVDTELRVAGET